MLRSVTFFDWVPPVSVVVGDQVEEGELSPEMEKDGLCKRSLSLFLSTLDFFFFFPGLSVLIIQLLIRARARRCGKGKAHHLEICQNGRRYITHMTDMFSMPARMSNRRRVPGKKKNLKIPVAGFPTGAASESNCKARVDITRTLLCIPVVVIAQLH